MDAPPPGTSGHGAGLLRRHRDFRVFWIGQSLSLVGAQVSAVALPLVATLTLDAGVAGVSAVATAAFLPNVVLPLVAGAWLETRRRRPVMVWADVLRAVILAIVPLAAVTGTASLPLLVAVAFVVGCAGVVFDIGSFAYVPTLVDEDDLPAANRATQGSATAAQVAGPGLAGLLVQALGPALAVAVDALSYVASALGVAAARRPELPPEPPEQRSGILSGLRQVLGPPVLRALTAHAALYNAAAQVLTVNLVVYAVTDRDVSPGWFGLALTAGGLGAFVGTLAALELARRLGYGHAFAGSLALSTGVPLTIAFLPGEGTAFAVALAVVQFVSGIGLGSANVLSVTLRQVVVPRTALARTNGGYRLLIFGVIPIGSAVGGVIGAALGSRVGVVAGTLGLAVSAAPMLARAVRTLRDPQDATPVRDPAAEARRTSAGSAPDHGGPSGGPA